MHAGYSQLIDYVYLVLLKLSDDGCRAYSYMHANNTRGENLSRKYIVLEKRHIYEMKTVLNIM